MNTITYPRSRIVLPISNDIQKRKKYRRPLTVEKKDINEKKYNLILDIDETLVYSRCKNENGEQIIKYRPGLFDFLDNTYEYFNIYLYTAGNKEYAKDIGNLLDKYKLDGGTYFNGIYSREHLKINNDGSYTKCLRTLHNTIMNDDGIDYEGYEKAIHIVKKIQYTVLVDNLYENMKYQPSNGINIIDYTGDTKDRTLSILSHYLINMVKSKRIVRLYNIENKINIAHILKRI